MRVRKRQLLGMWLLGLAVLVCLATASCESKHIQTSPQDLKQGDSEGQIDKKMTPLSKEQIIAIADAVAEKHRWSSFDRLGYEEGHRRWKEYMRREFGQGRHTRLEEDDYQAVLYHHREALLDGDLIILVDKNTGEVVWIREW